MLSDCRGCKYFHLNGCAVNPGYWKVERKLRKSLTQKELDETGIVLPCRDWEQAVRPYPIPAKVELRYYQRLPDGDVEYLPRPARPISMAVRRKSWLQHLFAVLYATPWMPVFLGVVLLAVSDPLFPGSLPGLRPIPQGVDASVGVCLALMVYHLTLWLLALGRGDSKSAGQRSDVTLVTLAVLTLLLIIRYGLA